MKTLKQAREIIAKLADLENEKQFAREVRAGAWDHRNDVQAAMLDTFKPRQLQTT